MIYSCFNEQIGMYEYLEDAAAHAYNADLPVPGFPPMAGEVGVPAREAARTAPVGVRKVGQGLQARGLLVRCDNESFQPLSGTTNTTGNAVVTLGILAFVGGIIYLSIRYGKPSHGHHYDHHDHHGGGLTIKL